MPFVPNTFCVGRPYFVMELVKGVPITEFCDANKLSTRERLDLFMAVCRAVQHAHQKGVIHRDLKPSNVMVSLSDGEPVPIVIDFGVAKALNRELTEKTLFTAYGQMIGTPQYMSPEQAAISRMDVDTRSDVYSLGVLLYELLTGTTPLDATRLRSTAFAELQRIIQEEDAPLPSTRLSTLGEQLSIVAQRRQLDPRGLRHALRGELDWIIMKALDKDRNRRYESASALAQDIERHLNDQPVLASPPSTLYKLRKFVRRNRTFVATTGAVAAALIIGTTLATIGLLQARYEQDLATRAKQEAVRERDRATRAYALAEARNQQLEQKNIQIRQMLLDQAIATAMSPDRPKTLESIATLEEAGATKSQLELIRGTLARAEGDLSAAREHLKRAEMLDPSSLAAKAQLLKTIFELGEFDEFNRLKSPIQQAVPVTAEDYVFKADALLDFNPTLALDVIERGQKLHDSPVAQLVHANALAKGIFNAPDTPPEQKIAVFSSAKDELRRLQGLLGADHQGLLEAMLPILRMNILLLRELGKEEDESLVAYAEDCVARLQASKNPRTWCELAWYYAGVKHDLDETEMAWSKATEYSSGDLWRTYYAGVLLHNHGMDRALEEFDMAPLRSRFSQIREGVFRAVDGQADRASQMWEQFGDEDPPERSTAVLVPLVLGDMEGLKRIRTKWTDDQWQWEVMIRWKLDYYFGELSDDEVVRDHPQSGELLLALKAISDGDREKAMRYLRAITDQKHIHYNVVWAIGILAEMERRPDWPKLPPHSTITDHAQSRRSDL